MDSLLSICDIKEDVKYILDLASKIKAGEMEEKPLEGKTLAMIFQKSSTRTRVSFDVGMYQLGGSAIFLSSNDLKQKNDRLNKKNKQLYAIKALNLEQIKKDNLLIPDLFVSSFFLFIL